MKTAELFTPLLRHLALRLFSLPHCLWTTLVFSQREEGAGAQEPRASLSVQAPVSSSGLKLPQRSQLWCIRPAPVLTSDFLSDIREVSWLYICLVNFLILSQKKKRFGVVWRDERFLLNPLSLANFFFFFFQNKLKNPNVLQVKNCSGADACLTKDMQRKLSQIYFSLKARQASARGLAGALHPTQEISLRAGTEAGRWWKMRAGQNKEAQFPFLSCQIRGPEAAFRMSHIRNICALRDLSPSFVSSAERLYFQQQKKIA